MSLGLGSYELDPAKVFEIFFLGLTFGMGSL